jgi:hypothetical protein
MRPLPDQHHGTTACNNTDSCQLSAPECEALLLPLLSVPKRGLKSSIAYDQHQASFGS